MAVVRESMLRRLLDAASVDADDVAWWGSEEDAYGRPCLAVRGLSNLAALLLEAGRWSEHYTINTVDEPWTVCGVFGTLLRDVRPGTSGGWYRFPDVSVVEDPPSKSRRSTDATSQGEPR